MKKICTITLAFILAMGLVACGRRNDTQSNDMTILHTMDPTIGTNIPDPEVDTKMPIYTDGTDSGNWTEPMQGSASSTESPVNHGN